MNILVINCGSSSIKYKLFKDNKVILSQIINDVTNHNNTLHEVFEEISLEIGSLNSLDAVGHRVVHGGEYFKSATIIDDKVITKIKKLIPLAPLHNKAHLLAIEFIKKYNPSIKQIAVFDTAFHQTMPKDSFIYPIPYEFYTKNKIRRYGFHGTSHQYVATQSAKFLNKPLDELNLITLHLGSGASITAIEKGKSIDTSMGFTPLEGLMMGTRCGDLDPAIVEYMKNQLKYSMEEIDDILNKKSGFQGICNENSMRKILYNVQQKDEMSILALDIYLKRVKKYIGAYILELGKVDAIIFTGGVGENSAYVRSKICRGFEFSLDTKIDEGINQLETEEKIYKISSNESKISVLVVNTDEELCICEQTKELIKN